MNHLGDTNKMVRETPISDSTPHNVGDLGMQIRRIERKLNAANDRIKRLEEALKCLTLVVGLTPIAGNKNALQEAMDIAIAELQAKETKL